MRATLIRNINDGLLYIQRQNKTHFLAEIHQGNVLKIRERITQLDNEVPEYEFEQVPTKDGTITILLKPRRPKSPVRPFGIGSGDAGGGGGGSAKGIYVELDGAQVGGLIKRLNFIGPMVTVATGAANTDNVTILIPSMTTAARTALVPTFAIIVEDTDLDMYFKWSTVTSSWNPF